MGKQAMYRRRGAVKAPAGFAYDPPQRFLAFAEDTNLLGNVADLKPPGCFMYGTQWRVVGGAWQPGASGTVPGVDFGIVDVEVNGTYEVQFAFRGPAPDFAFLSSWSGSAVVVVFM